MFCASLSEDGDEGFSVQEDDARRAGHWPVVGPGRVVSFTANGGTLVFVHPTDPALARVQVGIDAAVVADHHVTIRATLSDGQVQLSRFHRPPTIAGLSRLGERLSVFPGAGVVAVAEPTSMTWLGLHVALQRAGCDLSLVGTRHSARLRGAISGKLKSDVIDADVLSLASDVFALSPLDPPAGGVGAAPRGRVRRGKLVIDGNRARRRLISLARWAFPDVWTAFAGSWPTAIAVPDPLARLARVGRCATLERDRGRRRPREGVPGVAERAGAIRLAAAAWVEFWDGRLDLEALAWETAEHLRDITIASEQIERATTQAQRYWAGLYGDDPLLLSPARNGSHDRPTIRAFLGDGTRFVSAKAAASYAGLTPSTWSSGTVVQPSRAITKEGPAVLRLAFYQAANGCPPCRPTTGGLLPTSPMVERGHCHPSHRRGRPQTRRTDLDGPDRGQPYQFRDATGQAVTRTVARTRPGMTMPSPTTVRPSSARSAATHRSKLTK